MKIALAMISKGEGEDVKLKRALSSIAPFVDGIFVTFTTSLSDATKAVCEEFHITVSREDALWVADKKAVDWLKEFFGYEPYMKLTDKLFQFDVARNYNYAQVPKEYDWILWMDTDDVFRRGENLKRIAEAGLEQNIDAFYFNYIYQAEFDKDFNITHRIIEHLRERLTRNTGKFKWIAPIHETLIEQVPTRKTDVPDCDILHLATDADRQISLNRNLKNLELAIYRSEGKDPRHVYYLAKALVDMRTPETDDKALPLIMQYLQGEHKSGWPEERAQAWEYLCELYRRKGEHNNSLKAVLNSFTEPSLPTPGAFLNIALSWIMKGQYELSLFWVRMATSIPEVKTTLVKNVKDIQGRALEIVYNASLNLGKIDECWAAAEKMREMFPNEATVINAHKFISELRLQRDMTKNVLEIARHLKQTGQEGKLKSLVEAAPAISEETPFVIELANEVSPPRTWGEKEIAIYCGPGFTSWSPKRLADPKESFVGGSEEAVIRMSEALQKQGWSVTVYGDPGVDAGEYTGVIYLPYYKMNKRDSFNILIVWRQIGFFDQPITAKKAYLWNHDIQNPLEYTPERLKKITKVMFLSKWHRSNVPELPDEKVFVTSNGV